MKGHRYEDNIKFDFKQGLKIYSAVELLGTASISDILLNVRHIRFT